MTPTQPHDPIGIIRAQSRPLAAQPTGLAPQLRQLDGIRAVLWDIYGTLVISACGDISLAGALNTGDAFARAVTAIGLSCSGDGEEGAALLIAVIREEQERLAADGRIQAEIDIRTCWRTCLARAAAAGIVDHPCEDPAALEKLAVVYETQVNPVWDMPGATAILTHLRDAGFALGIVSNAQFFTPLLFPALLGTDLAAFGFDPSLCWFSYAHGYGKPDPWLYRQAVAALARRDLPPEACLYIGNDMRNDIWPAHDCGMHTALFAGDRRSLRRREDDPRYGVIEPDLILTHLDQLSGCL